MFTITNFYLHNTIIGFRNYCQLKLPSLAQSRCHSPRSSVGGIVGLWENAEENQPLIGCLIISLTNSLLIEIRAVLIIQEAKYKLVSLTRLFIASSTLRLHSTEQCIQKHNTNYTIEKYTYAQKNYTMQITCKHLTIYVHNKYFNWLAPIWFSVLIPGKSS